MATMLKDLMLENIQKLCAHQWKNFYHQYINSDIKRYEEIRKLTTGQEENYTTGCLLDYD